MRSSFVIATSFLALTGYFYITDQPRKQVEGNKLAVENILGDKSEGKPIAVVTNKKKSIPTFETVVHRNKKDVEQDIVIPVKRTVVPLIYGRDSVYGALMQGTGKQKTRLISKNIDTDDRISVDVPKERFEKIKKKPQVAGFKSKIKVKAPLPKGSKKTVTKAKINIKKISKARYQRFKKMCVNYGKYCNRLGKEGAQILRNKWKPF